MFKYEIGQVVLDTSSRINRIATVIARTPNRNVRPDDAFYRLRYNSWGFRKGWVNEYYVHAPIEGDSGV